ncbi:TVP38/TMEM64 family inner membrane protein YdjZ [Roseovarius albus]|uniref:TVP38/TMEM64 family membrane protein n=1 Tax=Roseovarius albus TaxID=1247867 RepID=A0A1X6YXX5_9RHOB|nr:TVP38/TMEM64 family protein [Roseovarius albus]SLN34990.1 TVP38/TMEM64 family inner membrane protein YdjZ [Roseovarius albus]
MEETRPSEKNVLMRNLPLAAIMIAAIIGYFTLGDYLSFDTLRDQRDSLLAFRDANFIGLVLCFIGIYFIIVAFSLPGAAVASVTGGFLFGLTLGTIFNVIAASLGAFAIFFAARWGLGRSLAAKLDSSDGTLKKIKTGLHENEISVLFLMRLIPVVPFFVANLVPALVGVKFRNFAFTTVLGIIPGAIVFTWIGVGLGEVFDRGESPDLSLLWEPQVIGPILGLCVLATLPIVIKAMRGNKDF